MKLIRHGSLEKEKTGIVLNDKYYDTSAFGQDYNEAFFADGGLEKLQQFVEQHKAPGGGTRLPQVPAGAPLGSPVARPSKIVCIGLHYADHPKETGATPPPQPRTFLKTHNAPLGASEDNMIPQNLPKK